MKQDLALRILDHGQSVLLTGPAGSGKTHVLNTFVGRAKAKGKHVAVTATTGLAATHLGGSTIHAWSGIGIQEALHPKYHESLSKNRLDTIRKANVLVIDEISMLHDYRLDLVDQLVRAVRAADRPFGGLQVVLCGDFFQLPPVNRSDGRPGGFVVNAQAWRELDPVICYLTEQHRQDDRRFLEILEALRRGTIDQDHVAALSERRNASVGTAELTELYTTNVDVDRINATRLAAIPGTEHRYEMTTTGKPNYVESLKRSCLAQEQLVLKRRALAMCIRNSLDRSYVNGSLGTVTSFDADTNYPLVKLRSGKTILMTPETWELRYGDAKRASLTQLPLRLAWAITVHKSQGMTLDAARIDLSRAFVPGMGYVALSRVRRLDALSLRGLNAMALQVSPEAQAIDHDLRQRSADAATRFAYLRNIQTGRSAKLNHRPRASSWADRLAVMRQQYPNAFRPWSGGDDGRLKARFAAGAGLKELTTSFGRHPGSIRARLKRHFGGDVQIPR